jgi:hypothetical protein
MSTGSENEREGLNAIGNPEVQVRDAEGGMPGEGNLGQVRPTGILARGTADTKLRTGRGGTAAGTERMKSRGR